ncbi:hypothetical protein FJ934_14715 [Mesorhizobium sp. B2-4-12]|uniref:hypothetical protein n=1 Tax=Mesorhizobium sp. B2-4-12 TaxID=2589937 RepID=UPI0011269C79|nr:hypothetical protein [Mesorhizobium sp. B2-4-12]TPK94611.1 hypothetical protein FJ934_14715 [Mesorhizobium sp. B2-4-12]
MADDFKLMTGTWVQAGKLRLNMLESFGGLVQDLVVAAMTAWKSACWSSRVPRNCRPPTVPRTPW